MSHLCTCPKCGNVHSDNVHEEYKQFLNGYQHGKAELPPANATASYQRGYQKGFNELTLQRANAATIVKQNPRTLEWDDLERMSAEPWEGRPPRNHAGNI